MTKRSFFLLLTLLIAIIAVFFIYKNNSSRVTAEKPVAEMIDSPGDSLGVAMETGVNQYFRLSNALTEGNRDEAAKISHVLQQWLDNLPLEQIKSNEGMYQLVTDMVSQSSTAAKNIAAVNNLEVQRKQFQMLSNKFYDLLRTVRYNEGAVYEIYCPMAFDNTGATWLSPTDEINNPYFGSKMLHCGEVRDSLPVKF